MGRKSSPASAQPLRMKPMSNSALWAAKGRPPTNFKKAARASAGFGAPLSISSVMPVRPTISGVSRRPGSTKVWKRSAIPPSLSTTAPISVMASRSTRRPVVSMSKQTISPWTAMRSSTSLMK